MPAQYNGQKISRVIVDKLMDAPSSQLEEKGGDGLRATESIASADGEKETSILCTHKNMKQ
jgi:hypothetical protein